MSSDLPPDEEAAMWDAYGEFCRSGDEHTGEWEGGWLAACRYYRAEIERWKKIAAAGLPLYSAIEGTKAWCIEHGVPCPPPVPKMSRARNAEPEGR